MVTVVTKTIGPSGRDYSTFTLAEAAITAIANAEFGSTDLVTADGAIVFEADAATYAESVTISGPWTTDATRNITFKAGAGSEHGGIPGTGVIIDPPTGTRPLLVSHEFTVVEGLNLLNDSTTAVWVDRNGVTLRNIVLTSTQRGFFLYAGIPSAPIVLENCVSRTSTATSHHAFWIFAYAGSSNARLVNCTGSVEDSTNQVIKVQQLALTATAEIVNCLVLTDRAFTSTGTTTGSNNFGGSTDPFPAALQGTPYPITASTAYDPGAGDFALYVGKNGALLDSPNNDVIDAGIGPASNSDVPTTDILGDTRSGTTTNPGAFALAQATAVLTKTIGPVGRDYATFTTAEADVTNIGGSADLVFENERIEFEADAATYDEEVNWQSSLTTDATRNVTYKPAAGSEHGGVFGAGVVLLTSGASYGATQTIRDSFLVLDGIECHASDTSSYRYALNLAVTSDLLGVTVRNCLLWSQTNRACFQSANSGSYDQGSAAAPIVLENCVLRSTDNVKDMMAASERPGYEMYLRVINCTFIGDSAGNHRAFNVGGTSSTNYEFSNNLILVPAAWYQSTSTYTLTGGSNFAGSSQALPAAIQGNPYPVTATTSTDPGFGDYAIYNASTGALVVVDDNTALGLGVGPAANADVPTLDILGVRRIGGGCDPGAFEGDRSRSTDVWDVPTATHTTPGSFGELVQNIPTTSEIAAAVPSAAEVASAVWAALTNSNNVNGSFGRMTQQTHLSATRAGSLYLGEEEE